MKYVTISLSSGSSQHSGKRLRAYCKSKGISLIGDIPLFVAHQSADVWLIPGFSNWMRMETLQWSREYLPIISPRQGSCRGVPVYRWEALQKQNYSWWIERLRTAFGRFDINRLDHFIGFVRTYEVPAQAKTAVNGHYQIAGGASFFKTARQALGSLLIADDSGVQTPPKLWRYWINFRFPAHGSCNSSSVQVLKRLQDRQNCIQRNQ